MSHLVVFAVAHNTIQWMMPSLLGLSFLSALLLSMPFASYLCPLCVLVRGFFILCLALPCISSFHYLLCGWRYACVLRATTILPLDFSKRFDV